MRRFKDDPNGSVVFFNADLYISGDFEIRKKLELFQRQRSK